MTISVETCSFDLCDFNLFGCCHIDKKIKRGGQIYFSSLTFATDRSFRIISLHFCPVSFVELTQSMNELGSQLQQKDLVFLTN